MTDHNRTQPARPAGAESGASIERVRQALERLRSAEGRATGGSDTHAMLERGADLLAALQDLISPLETRIASGEWNPAEAVSARAALDIYDRAVTELRRVADTARRHVEEAERLFEEVHEFARESRHRAERLERRMSGKAD